jgi:ElaB/YqjD/DUF883 family membrane-anchored ribosome-binding protein
VDRANERLARHYEQEAETTRHSLASTLRELNARLTPGQMFDEVMSYTKSGGGTFTRAFSKAVRDNPFPALLISTGCMLFLSERMGLIGRTSAHRAGDYGRDDEIGEQNRARVDDDQEGIGDSMKQKASDMTEGVKQGLASVGEKLSDTSQRVRDKASELGEGIGEAVDQVKERAQNVREKISETAVHTGEQARNAGRQIAERTSTYMHEQPLIMTGLGLAIGAAIAAVLPSTRVENQVMGRTADNIKRKIGAAASQQFETVKDSAGEFVQKVKDVAEREGLTPGSAASEMMRNLRSKENGQSTPEGHDFQERTESDEFGRHRP